MLRAASAQHRRSCHCVDLLMAAADILSVTADVRWHTRRSTAEGPPAAVAGTPLICPAGVFRASSANVWTLLS